MHHVGVLPVALRVDRARLVVLPIDVSAVTPVPRADAKSQGIRDDGAADRGAALIARRAILRIGNLRARIAAVGREARGWGDETNRPALRARAPERPLRAAQDLDALEIEHLGKGIADEVLLIGPGL